jgi:hypothetical protein
MIPFGTRLPEGAACANPPSEGFAFLELRVDMAVDEYSMWLERFRTGQNDDQLQRSYEELIRTVKRFEPMTLAETTDGRFRGDGIPRVELSFLYSWFVLELLPYRLRAGHPELDTLPMKVLVLQHLVAAAENQGTAVRVMGQWIDCRSLQHGAVLGAHFSRSTTETLGRFFAMPREKRLGAVLRWGGKPADHGDESYRFDFFPRLPVVLIHWRADEEFAAYSKVLFDVSASNYMPTHALVALTEFLIFRLAEGV